MNINKKSFIAIIIWNIVISGLLVYMLAFMSDIKKEVYASASVENANPTYTLYIGLNDKDTYTQLIDTKDAKQIINNICLKYTSGYSVTQLEGGWIDEKDNLTEENTLCYMLTDIDESDVNKIMDEVLEKLNQNSILVQVEEHKSMYYSHIEN